jgi:hypothetical protein
MVGRTIDPAAGPMDPLALAQRRIRCQVRSAFDRNADHSGSYLLEKRGKRRAAVAPFENGQRYAGIRMYASGRNRQAQSYDLK